MISTNSYRQINVNVGEDPEAAEAEIAEATYEVLVAVEDGCMSADTAFSMLRMLDCAKRRDLAGARAIADEELSGVRLTLNGERICP